jgi:hypothetical protein
MGFSFTAAWSGHSEVPVDGVVAGHAAIGDDVVGRGGPVAVVEAVGVGDALLEVFVLGGDRGQ